MKLRILSVGKATTGPTAELINEYQKRLPKHWQLAWEFLPTSDKAKESERLLRMLGTSFVVLLDERGSLYTNQQLADLFETLQNDGTKELCIIIGGAFGVNDEVIKRVDAVWSFSPLVFPHQLMRILLTEQLYRTADILAGGKYHHN